MVEAPYIRYPFITRLFQGSKLKPILRIQTIVFYVSTKCAFVISVFLSSFNILHKVNDTEGVFDFGKITIGLCLSDIAKMFRLQDRVDVVRIREKILCDLYIIPVHRYKFHGLICVVDLKRRYRDSKISKKQNKIKTKRDPPPQNTPCK